MIAICFTFCGILLLFLKALADLPLDSIFDKFHQSDFKSKFEHIDADHYNKDFVKHLEVVTFKYNRTTTVCNITLEVKMDFGNDVEIIIQTYKFASNEYRLFPLRFQVNSCLAISKDLIGIGNYAKCGNFSGCPVQKNKVFRICNWAPDESKYPPFLPTGRYQVDLQFLYKSTEIFYLKAYAEVYRPISIPN